MPFSIRCGLTRGFLTMLPFLLVQVVSQRPMGRSALPGPAATCCMSASNGTFNEPVTACFEQKENTIRGCRVHAYVFHTENNKWCADPGAWWIPQRLKRLERRGIHCQIV